MGSAKQSPTEWRDGVASALICEAVSDEGPGQKWVVYDGPVDAVWVENMDMVGCSCYHLGCVNGCAAGLSSQSAAGAAFIVAGVQAAADATFDVGVVHDPSMRGAWC